MFEDAAQSKCATTTSYIISFALLLVPILVQRKPYKHRVYLDVLEAKEINTSHGAD